MVDPTLGDIVKWANGKKPLGLVVNKFIHRENCYAVVETLKGLIVVRIYERLQIVK